MRRLFIILAVVIVLGGIGAAAYYYFFGNTAEITVAPPGTLPTAGDATPVPEPIVDTTAVVTSVPTTVSARLVKISKGPVVPGEVVINRPATASTTAETIVNYIDRQSGNIYSYFVRAGTITRTSNRTVPGIQSAAWLPDGSSAFVRYLSGSDFSTVNSYSLPANGLGGFFLAQNLSDLAVSSTGILTLSSGTNGSVGSVARTNGTQSSQIFTSPLSELRASFAGKSQYLTYTRPTATLPGVAHLVDGAGSFSRIAGPLRGLVAKASPSGKWVLVSYMSDESLRMMLVEVATGESIALPVATIAEKCVWTADDAAIYCGVPAEPPTGILYPDDWYQGVVSFSDRIWKIQVSGRYAQFVLDFSTEGELVDVQAPAIDPLSTVLVFINKRDGSLWSYSL